MPAQQSVTVVTQPQGAVPQQGAIGAQVTQSTPPVKSTQSSFLPGFSAQKLALCPPF